MAAASVPIPRVSEDFAYDDEDESIMTGEAVALDLRPTSFVLAAAGSAIDWALYFIGGTLFIIFCILLPLAQSPLGQDSASVAAISLASEVMIIVIIPAVVELVSRGKSLGRLAVGARIVRDDGGSIGFRHAFIRSLVAVLEIFMLFGGLAALVGLLNGKSKRLGDYLAGTYSQYERVGKYQPFVFGVPAELTAWAATADVARLPDRVARRIAQFLRQAGQLMPYARDQLSRQLAAEASAWVAPIPPVNAELFLAGIVALRRDREFAGLMLENERLSRLDAALTGMPHDFARDEGGIRPN
jgi:uncharacterized RDD family membrane protein YckC